MPPHIRKHEAPAKVLYVTSFARDMYEASGERLISSFASKGVPGKILCFVEGFDLPKKTNRVIERRLDGDPILDSWLVANLDVIPTHLGGRHEGCQCPGGPLDVHSKMHSQPCVGYWFNRNASRWFRKVVALYRAMDQAADVLVWLDSDCFFKKKLPEEQVARTFKSRAVFYMQSRRRKVLESGIMGFFLDRGGRRFIELTLDRYRSGEFRKHPRWDDCYQWQLTRDKHKDIPSTDIATRASGHADVARHSTLKDFLEHDKGRHGRGLGLMK